MSEKELLCILGHNGAGKSTMISVLTGLTAPSSGTATLGGYDIVEEIDEVRQIIGVVPQFDILWEELTAEEHMRMFCKIKGVPEDKIDQVIDEKLTAVKLLDVKKARSKTFSGGMKRRLTVAISCIGEPKIVFMDEPTTGMDPVSRRQVWDLIQELKSKRYVVLTTHSMEEADVLGDRIAVIVDGEFK
jgi:ABC-type multidrug transport system ATPase subunit